MKLLLDENLSPKLAKSLQDMFPGTMHVEDCGLGAADDEQIWRFAKENDYVIVSKDSDFYDRSALYGGPPKVVWVRVGNCTTKDLESVLRRSKSSLAALAVSPDTTLILFRSTTQADRSL
jgi:predicted nuclease of predicted toxin-antitoxin system